MDALSSPDHTRMVLVARAQPSTLREVARTLEEFSAIGLTGHHLVLNGVFPESAADGDPLAASIVDREQTTIAHMPEVLRTLPRDEVALKPFNMVGVETLRHLLTSEPAVHPAIGPADDRCWRLRASARWSIRSPQMDVAS